MKLKQRLARWFNGNVSIYNSEPLSIQYKEAVEVIAKAIVHSKNRLTPEYLMERNWVEENGYYIEPNIKDRDRISISFEHHYYRVWHGGDRTFFALESSIEWFELYYLLSHGDRGRYRLAGI